MKYLLSFFPSRLPITKAEFDAWIDSVMELRPAGIPDTRAIRFALAAMVLHIKDGYTHIPKRFFVKKLHRAASNEIAYAFMEECKAAHKSEEADKQAQEQANKTIEQHSDKPALSVVKNEPS